MGRPAAAAARAVARLCAAGGGGRAAATICTAPCSAAHAERRATHTWPQRRNLSTAAAPDSGGAGPSRSLPPGGVLVFLTGQREVEHLCRKLRATFNRPPRQRGAGAAAAPQAPEAGGGEEAADVAAAAAAAEEAAGLDAFSGDAAEAGAAAGEDEAALLALLEQEDRAAAGEGPADDYEAESSGGCRPPGKGLACLCHCRGVRGAARLHAAPPRRRL